ncbi:MAG: hypothetical protein QM802_01210 [Agriterribacter sp.]
MSDLNAADVKARIAMLEEQTKAMESGLKERLNQIGQKFTPGNILKSTISDFNTTPGLKSTIFSTILNLGLSFVGGRMLLGKGGIAKKAAGAALQFGAGKLIGKKIDVLKRFASNLFTKKEKVA